MSLLALLSGANGYMEGGVEQAAKAQKVFSSLTKTSTVSDKKDVINSDEYVKLKIIYQNASDEMIFQVMDFMK